MTEKLKCYRHGDVILREVESVPSDAKKREAKQLVLAEGEVTGHAHQVSGGVGALFDYDDKVYLRIESEIGALTHEEHAKIELPAGSYEVFIQKDYTPKGWEKVVD